MSSPQRPSDAVIAKTLQDKATESIASEPECRTRFFRTMNKQCAQKRENIYLRLPQPAPGHGLFTAHAWTKEEADRYLADGTLPSDLTTVNQDGTTILLWIFDARDCGGKLPEVEFERVPDFEKHPAPAHSTWMGRSGPNKVKFVLNEKKTREQSKDGKQAQAGKEGEDDGKQGLATDEAKT